MEICTISEARADFDKLMKYTADTHEPVYIVGKGTKSVMISVEEYEDLMKIINRPLDNQKR